MRMGTKANHSNKGESPRSLLRHNQRSSDRWQSIRSPAEHQASQYGTTSSRPVMTVSNVRDKPRRFKASASHTKFQFECTILQIVRLKWLRSPNRLNPAENPPYAEMNTSHERTSRGQPLQHNHNVSKVQCHAESYTSPRRSKCRGIEIVQTLYCGWRPQEMYISTFCTNAYAHRRCTFPHSALTLPTT